MRVNLNYNTKIRFQGHDYNSIEEMPPEARAAYQEALAKARGTSSSVQTKIVLNGHEYTSVDQMPAPLRALYQGLMSNIDADNNGIPYILEKELNPTGNSGALPHATASTSAPSPPLQQQDSSTPWESSSLSAADHGPVVSTSTRAASRSVPGIGSVLIALLIAAALCFLLWSQIH